MPKKGSRESTQRGMLWESLHIFALSSFAVAQPLYDLLGSKPEFFVANNAGPGTLIAFVGLVALGIPGAIVGVLAVARLLGTRFHDGCLFVVVAALSAIIVLPLFNRIEGLAGGFTIALAVLAGTAAALIYRRSRGVRQFVTAMSPAGVIFAAWFLFGTSVSKIVLPTDVGVSRTASTDFDTPVVFVIFDMLSLPTMLDADGKIDRGLFPAFASLAARSHWFKNASTVATNTGDAVPSILTGVYPRHRALPIAIDHPHNLFTLMGPWADLHVSEFHTQLCPPTLCGRAVEPFMVRMRKLLGDVWVVYQHIVMPEDLKQDLPSINTEWGNFGAGRKEGVIEVKKRDSKKKRNGKTKNTEDDHMRTEANRRRKESPHEDRMEKFQAFLNVLENPKNNSLFYLHLNLPHTSFDFLPSGKTYIPSGKRYRHMRQIIGRIPTRGADDWVENWQLIGLSYQRYLLQASFTDRLLGELIDRMEEVGLFDRALFVVVSDHGMTFAPGEPSRLSRDCATHCVPLFVKVPGQKEGVVSETNVETTDILPTIADVLGLQLPWEVNGHSVFSSSAEGRGTKYVMRQGIVTELEWPGDYLQQALRRSLDLKALTMNPDARATIGPSPDIVGRRVEDVVTSGRAAYIVPTASKNGGVGVEIDQRTLLEAVESNSDFVPTYITGRIVPSGKDGRPLSIAVAINGVVQATTYTFEREKDEGQFALLVPESAIKPGRNQVRVLKLHDP